MKKVLVLSLALILILGITSHGTSSYFSDTETSSGNTFTAWVEECENPCGNHCITFVSHTWDGTHSTWTYEVTSGTHYALGSWVMEWECDCSAVIAVYENGVLLPHPDESEDDENQWECGCHPTTDLCGIKFENGYDDWETRTVSIVLDGDYPEGVVTIGMKSGQEIFICEVWGPVCYDDGG